jgi:transposase
MRKPSQEADAFRRIEVITGVGRRRRWPDDVRAAIVAETLEEGAVVSAVARRYGLAPSQIFAWRKAARERASNLPAGMAAFAAVTLDSTRMTGTALKEPPPPLMIEVELGGARLRIPPDAARDAILAVMEGLGALKRRR